MKFKFLIFIIPSLALLFSAFSGAGVIYHTSLGANNNQLWKYDTGLNNWSRLNDYKTGSNFAVDQIGNMYAYNGSRSGIDKYDSLTDTWNTLFSAPILGGSFASSSYNFFNLEITNSGRFLLTGNNTSNLFYSDGGAWASTALGFNAGAVGDYDPNSDTYAINAYGGKNPIIIDTNTFVQTSFTPAGNGSEWRRSGTIVNGKYYDQSGGSAVQEWDLSQPLNAPSILTNTPVNLRYMASTADRVSGTLYAADIWSSDFYKYDGTDWTALSGDPGGNHTSIAFVGDSVDVPEPSTLAIFALGMIGLASRRFKKQS